MTKTKLERITRSLTAEEKARHAQIRDQVRQEFPPADQKRQPLSTGIAADLRRARKARGLTDEAVAKKAGLPNANTGGHGQSPRALH